MVFHWSLKDSKSPQVSRTLLSILSFLSNAVYWIVSTRLPTSKSSRRFNNPLVNVPKAPITIGTIVNFMFHSFFQFSSKVEVLILLFTFFQFYFVVSWDSKVDNFVSFLFSFFFFVDYFWPRLGDLFMCVIFKDRCWVVHIPFVSVVKFRFLAHFPVDYLADLVVSSLMLLLC